MRPSQTKKEFLKTLRETVIESNTTAPGKSATDVATFVGEAGGVTTMSNILDAGFPEDAILKALQNGAARGGDAREAPLLKGITFEPDDDAEIVVWLTNKGWTQAGYTNRRESKPSAGQIAHKLAPGQFAAAIEHMQNYNEQDGLWEGPRLSPASPLGSWLGQYRTFEVLTGADAKAEIDAWPARTWPIIQTRDERGDGEDLGHIRGRTDLWEVSKAVAGRFLKEGQPPIRPDAFLKIADAPSVHFYSCDWGNLITATEQFGGNQHWWRTVVTNTWRRQFNCGWTCNLVERTDGRTAKGFISGSDNKAVAVNNIEQLPPWTNQSIFTLALEFEFNSKSRAALMQKVEAHCAAIIAGLIDGTLWVVNNQRVARDLERILVVVTSESGVPSDRMRLMSWRSVNRDAPILDLDPSMSCDILGDHDNDAWDAPLADCLNWGALKVDLGVTALDMGHEVWNHQAPVNGWSVDRER